MSQEMQAAIEAFLTQNSPGFTFERVVWLLTLFVCCLVAMRIIMFLLGKTVARLRIEKTLQSFIKSLVRALLWVVLVILILGFLGVPVASLIALLSVAGLAVSLAIQGTLSNLAGGLMILVSKPFKVGDYIEAGGVAGTVSGITLAYTKLLTVDRKAALIPNSEIASAKLVNFSAEENRRVELTITVDAAVPVARVREAALALIHSHPKTLFTPPPEVRLKAIREGALEYVIRVWCANPDYLAVYHDLLEQIQETFPRQGLPLTGGYQRVKATGIEPPLD